MMWQFTHCAYSSIQLEGYLDKEGNYHCNFKMKYELYQVQIKIYGNKWNRDDSLWEENIIYPK